MTVTPSVFASIPASGHTFRMSDMALLKLRRKLAISWEVSSSLVVKLAAIMSQVKV